MILTEFTFLGWEEDEDAEEDSEDEDAGLCLMLDWETRLLLETLTFGIYFFEFKPEYNVLCTES